MHDTAENSSLQPMLETTNQHTCRNLHLAITALHFSINVFQGIILYCSYQILTYIQNKKYHWLQQRNLITTTTSNSTSAYKKFVLVLETACNKSQRRSSPTSPCSTNFLGNFSNYANYAASKASGEHFVQVYHKSYDLPAVVVRMCNVYGPRQSPTRVQCRNSFNKLPVESHSLSTEMGVNCDLFYTCRISVLRYQLY